MRSALVQMARVHGTPHRCTTLQDAALGRRWIMNLTKAKEFVQIRQALLDNSALSKEEIIKGFKEIRKENRRMRLDNGGSPDGIGKQVSDRVVTRKTVAKFLRDQAAIGSTEAMVILSNTYFSTASNESNKNGIAVLDPPVSATEALDLLVQAGMNAENPNPDALYNLASLYWEGGSELVGEDKQLAIKLFRKGADELDDPPSQFFLGMLCHRGLDPYISKDVEKSEFYLKKASTRNGGALVYYAQALLSGDDGFRRESKENVIKLLEANAGNDSDALLLLGDLYLESGGVGSMEKALEVFVKAGELGSGTAWNNAGAILATTFKDPSRARDCYARGASIGDPECIRNLAYMHAKGEGLPNRDIEYSAQLLKMLRAIEGNGNRSGET